MIDTSSEFGARADRLLREENVIWLTTVGRDGTPRPALVWFLYDGDRILVYSDHRARRVDHLADRPRVALNVNSDAWGDSMVVLTGTARIARELPSAADNPAYLAKYRERIEIEKAWDGVAGFVAVYSVPLEITDLKLSGF